MYIKSLSIQTNCNDVRTISFHSGMNIIVGEKPEKGNSGNDVGKTTMLRLIGYGLGMDMKWLFTNSKTKKVNKVFRQYFKDNDVMLTLCLVRDFNRQDQDNKIVITRQITEDSSMARCYIDSKRIEGADFHNEIKKILFPNILSDKPTLPQLMSEYMRYFDNRLYQTFETLDRSIGNTLRDYETLLLAMFGLVGTESAESTTKMAQLREEREAMSKDQRNSSECEVLWRKHTYEEEAKQLKKRIDTLNVNENIETDLAELDSLKQRVNVAVAELETYKMRYEIINETVQDYANQTFECDNQQLEDIYAQASNLHIGLSKTFGEMVDFHNKMLRQREAFIKQDLPDLKKKIAEKKTLIDNLNKKEKAVAARIYARGTMEDMQADKERLAVVEQQLVECDNDLNAIASHLENVKRLNNEVKGLHKSLYSFDNLSILRSQLESFFEIYSPMVDYVRDGKLQKGVNDKNRIDVKVDRREGHPFFRFVPADPTASNGFSEADAACFIISYIQYARMNNINCLDFVLLDQFEALDDEPMMRLREMVLQTGVQCIVAVLKDKLPEEMQHNDKEIIKGLSTGKKLFMIEQTMQSLFPNNLFEE